MCNLRKKKKKKPDKRWGWGEEMGWRQEGKSGKEEMGSEPRT